METKKTSSEKKAHRIMSNPYFGKAVPNNFWDMNLAKGFHKMIEAKLTKMQMPTMYISRNFLIEAKGGYKSCDTCESGEKLKNKETGGDTGWLECEDCKRKKFVGIIE